MKTVAFKWSIENKQVLDSYKKKKNHLKKTVKHFHSLCHLVPSMGTKSEQLLILILLILCRVETEIQKKTLMKTHG